MARHLASTVNEAVALLVSLLPVQQQTDVAEFDEHQLEILHFGIGSCVRNSLGLYLGNEDLLADTGALGADGASAVIVRTLWKHLRNQQP
jgi:hypothetical protein